MIGSRVPPPGLCSQSGSTRFRPFTTVYSDFHKLLKFNGINEHYAVLGVLASTTPEHREGHKKGTGATFLKVRETPRILSSGLNVYDVYRLVFCST
jgi:hypothetical protein